METCGTVVRGEKSSCMDKGLFLIAFSVFIFRENFLRADTYRMYGRSLYCSVDIYLINQEEIDIVSAMPIPHVMAM